MTRHTIRFATLSAHAGLAAALALGMLAAPACKAGEDAGKKAERAAEKAGAAAEKVGEKVGDAAEKAGEKIGEAAEKIGDKIGPAARNAASKGAAVAAAVGADAAITAAGALRTGSVKAALLEDSTIDVSDVDVDTDQVTRHITLKGHVRSAAVREKVIDITRDTAPGYTIDNQLTIR
jgi:hypothetical protein